MNFKQQLAQRTKETEQIICSFLPEESGQQKLLLEAANYSVRAGGKRLRPLLMYTVYRMFGGKDPEMIGPFMAAMEMIHTHSLVHDDLPAMDNDLYRRGKKTTWAVYGDGMAVLAGDSLLNLAYETAAGTFTVCPGNIHAEKALLTLARKTGIFGMIGGQSVDVQMDGKALDDGQLSFIYALKTGALLEASLMVGALLAGAGEDTVRELEQIGREVGLAFQIRDDILYVTGDEKTLGKPVGSDAKNEKTTYVVLHGLEASQEKAEQLTQSALRRIDTLAEHAADAEETAFLRALCLSLAERSS